MFYILTPSITEIQVSPEAFASKGGGGGEPEPKEAAALQWGRREAVAGEEGDGSSMGGYHPCVPLSGRFGSAHKALALVRPSSPSPPPAWMPAPSPYSATSPYWFPPHYMVLIIFLLIFTHCYFFSLLFFYQYP